MPSIALRRPSHFTRARRPLRRALILSLLVASISIALPGAAAARGTAAGKFGRGATNFSLGILALPGQVVKTTREQGPFLGATWGVVKGVGWTVATEFVGLWEIVTCPFEMPPDYEPILSPEYPWGHFIPEKS